MITTYEKNTSILTLPKICRGITVISLMSSKRNCCFYLRVVCERRKQQKDSQVIFKPLRQFTLTLCVCCIRVGICSITEFLSRRPVISDSASVAWQYFFRGHLGGWVPWTAFPKPHSLIRHWWHSLYWRVRIMPCIYILHVIFESIWKQHFSELFNCYILIKIYDYAPFKTMLCLPMCQY